MSIYVFNRVIYFDRQRIWLFLWKDLYRVYKRNKQIKDSVIICYLILRVVGLVREFLSYLFSSYHTDSDAVGVDGEVTVGRRGAHRLSQWWLECACVTCSWLHRGSKRCYDTARTMQDLEILTKQLTFYVQVKALSLSHMRFFLCWSSNIARSCKCSIQVLHDRAIREESVSRAY